MFKIEKTQLQNALIKLSAFWEKKDLSNVVSCVYVEVEDNILTMYATDYEYSLKLETTSIMDYQNCKFIVSGNSFLSTVKRLKGGEVEVLPTKNDITIKQGRSKITLDCMDIKEFPVINFKTDGMSKVNVNAEVLNDGISKALFSIDPNSPKFELQSMLFEFDEVLKIVSTDTRVCSLVNTSLPTNDKMQLLIPKKSIIELQKVINGNCDILFDDVNLIVKNENSIFQTKLTNGKFVDYTRIMRDKSEKEFIVPVKELRENINIVNALELNIRLIFNGATLTIESESKKSTSEMTIDNNIEDEVKVMFSSQQLLNAIDKCETEFKLGINKSSLPCLLEYANYKAIIMPLIEAKGE